MLKILSQDYYLDYLLPRCWLEFMLLENQCQGDNFQFARERYGERMRILYELSWLWETLVIALAAAAVCVVCAMLICKAVKKNLSKKRRQLSAQQRLRALFWQSL